MNLWKMYLSTLPSDICKMDYLKSKIFRIVSSAAKEQGVRAFVIGGYVRDCFLGRPCKDIDIVVEGSGIALAEKVAKMVGSKLSVFRNFGTAMLRYRENRESEWMEIEFVGARKESYRRESRKPIVEDGTLEEDQQRRDFTINALAFSLQAEDYGSLVDPFNGMEDLRNGLIRTPLDPDTTYTNGPFYVKQWEFDPYGKNNHMILRKNKMFSEEMDISPSSLNFFIEKKYSDRIADFEKEDIDCIITDGSDDFIADEDYSYTEYKYKTYGIMVNTDNSYFSQIEAREAICLSIDRGIYKEELTRGRTPAYAIIPPAVNILNKSYRDLISDQAKTTYNPSLAKEKWDTFLQNNDISSLTGVNIIVKEGTENTDDLNRITSQWQQNIGFFCGIEVLPEKEYNRRIEENEYLLALTDITADNNSPRDILSQFMTGDEDNTFGYSNDKFDEIFDKAIHSEKLSDSVQLYSDAESAIIDDYSFIPVFYESEYLIYPKEIQGIGYNPFTKELDFIHAKNFD
mgnify:CR=1 FL=1